MCLHSTLKGGFICILSQISKVGWSELDYFGPTFGRKAIEYVTETPGSVKHGECLGQLPLRSEKEQFSELELIN